MAWETASSRGYECTILSNVCSRDRWKLSCNDHRQIVWVLSSCPMSLLAMTESPVYISRLKTSTDAFKNFQLLLIVYYYIPQRHIWYFQGYLNLDSVFNTKDPLIISLRKCIWFRALTSSLPHPHYSHDCLYGFVSTDFSRILLSLR